MRLQIDAVDRAQERDLKETLAALRLVGVNDVEWLDDPKAIAAKAPQLRDAEIEVDPGLKQASDFFLKGFVFAGLEGTLASTRRMASCTRRY
jgi:hypothetical protein